MWNKFSIKENYKIGDVIMVNLASHSIEGKLLEVYEDSLVITNESETGEQFANNILLEYILFITQKWNIKNVEKLMKDNNIKGIDIPIEEDEEDYDFDDDDQFPAPQPG